MQNGTSGRFSASHGMYKMLIMLPLAVRTCLSKLALTCPSQALEAVKGFVTKAYISILIVCFVGAVKDLCICFITGVKIVA
jgi:hypothetical protein